MCEGAGDTRPWEPPLAQVSPAPPPRTRRLSTAPVGLHHRARPERSPGGAENSASGASPGRSGRPPLSFLSLVPSPVRGGRSRRHGLPTPCRSAFSPLRGYPAHLSLFPCLTTGAIVLAPLPGLQVRLPQVRGSCRTRLKRLATFGSAADCTTGFALWTEDHLESDLMLILAVPRPPCATPTARHAGQRHPPPPAPGTARTLGTTAHQQVCCHRRTHRS